jgi:N-methylhydantoinase A
LGVTVEASASGVIRLVNEATIDALKLISVRRGYDPRDFSLVAFGGGGPMHAAALAEELGVKRLIIPPFPGTFSAWGMLMSQPRVDLTQTRVTRLDTTTPDDLEQVFTSLESEAADRLLSQGFTADQIGDHRRNLDMRYHGQEHTVRVAVSGSPDLAALETAFHERHRQSYTFALVGTPVEIVHFRTISMVQISRPGLGQPVSSHNGAPGRASQTSRTVDFGDGVRRETSIFVRSALFSGFMADGPAIIEEPSATTLVMPGQQLVVDPFGNLVISPAPVRPDA